MNAQARKFTIADQQWFARVSGDENPLHLDAAWAAIRFPGEIVVHGLHAVLWGLDRHLAQHRVSSVPGLHATFLKPIVVGDVVEVESADGGAVFKLLVRGEPMAVVRLQSPTGKSPALRATAPAQPARDGSGGPFLGVAGAIDLPAGAQELAGAWPAVVAAIGPQAPLGLAALSTLVGMECPGLQSLLSEFSVFLTGSQAVGPLRYRVKRYDAAFSRLEMEVSGLGIAGTIAAFAGQGEPSPASNEVIRGMVSATEFTGQRPLVVGASGGLGAAAARLLAAGGARPTLTWHRGRDATEAIVRAVSALNGHCDLIELDVGNPATGLAALANAGWSGGQLYYLASPRIFRRRLEPYQADDLREFLKIYVDGLYEVVRGIMNFRPGAPLSVFYPSSVAVSEAETDLFEYKIAKLAGEQLCSRLQRKYKSLNVKVARLPRIATRQTRTFFKVHADTPERVMLPIVKEVQAAQAADTVETR